MKKYLLFRANTRRCAALHLEVVGDIHGRVL